MELKKLPTNITLFGNKENVFKMAETRQWMKWLIMIVVENSNYTEHDIAI